jgi:signal transduction histidine kinase
MRHVFAERERAIIADTSMGARKRHPAHREAPRRYQSGAIPIPERLRREKAHPPPADEAHPHSQTAELTAALDARDELFSIAAHDLKTPLTSLKLHVQALQRSLVREPVDLARARRSADEAERHAERMATLIEQLLDVARIRKGKLEVSRGPADLAAIVREVGARFGPEIANRGATIIIDAERSVPGRWDPLRLEQIVTNLVSNALKYGEGNPIVLEVRSSAARARLTVRDYGPGIPVAEQERIFEPFERATTDTRTRGAGLGLWIVRRLVEAHGGEVSVSSVPGKGATFIVDLPRSER